MKIPNGLRYHVIDIYTDELDQVDTPRSGNLPIDALFAPLRSLGAESPTKAVRLRVKEALGDERLVDWNNLEQAEREERVEKGAGDDEDEEWAGIED
jgi:ribosomal RNA-processing protein 1